MLVVLSSHCQAFASAISASCLLSYFKPFGDPTRLWRGPWTTARSNQSILKEISPEYSLQGLMLKLKLPYFGHLMQTADSLEKTLILGKTEGKRRKGAIESEMVR